MAVSPWQQWRLCVGLALVLAAGPPRAAAQEAGWETYYSRQNAFMIPFRFDANDRRIQSVLLQVSEDLGRTYQQQASAAPSARGFRFTATHDGWYWFAVQTRDTDGRLYPPSMAQVQQGIKVCVDTKPPVVTLRPAAPREGTVAVEWEVRDDNTDLNTLRVEYRPSGGPNWYPLPVPRLERGEKGWDPRVNGPVEVRLQVMDRARNSAQATTTVTPGAYQPPPGATAAPAGAAGDGPRGKVVHVRSLTFNLNYEFDNVGPSQVKTVEIWWTRNRHQWQKYPDSAKPQGPYPVRVQEEGSYGFTLIPRSGVGLAARPPEPGEEPQIWIEVDATRPVVAVHSAVVGPDTGKLTVTWSARDRWLRAQQPINLSYAQSREGPWLPLPGAERLDNAGTFTCATDALPFQIYVRVTATDEAGNVGSDIFRDAVKIDLKVPQVRSINVTASETGAPPPQPQ
jgi:hypothetical protein